jgi:hypothetical protein
MIKEGFTEVNRPDSRASSDIKNVMNSTLQLLDWGDVQFTVERKGKQVVLEV